MADDDKTKTSQEQPKQPANDKPANASQPSTVTDVKSPEARAAVAPKVPDDAPDALKGPEPSPPSTVDPVAAASGRRTKKAEVKRQPFRITRGKHRMWNPETEEWETKAVGDTVYLTNKEADPFLDRLERVKDNAE